VGKIKEFDTQIEALQERLAAVQAKIEPLTDKLSQNTAALDEQNARAEEIQVQVDRYQCVLADYHGKLAKWKASIAEAEKKLRELQDARKAQEEELEVRLQSRVASRLNNDTDLAMARFSGVSGGGTIDSYTSRARVVCNTERVQHSIGGRVKEDCVTEAATSNPS
jgi:chromosome segregation ATPase